MGSTSMRSGAEFATSGQQPKRLNIQQGYAKRGAMSWFRYCVNMVQSNQHRNSVILVNLQQGSQEQKWESNPVETAFHPLFESTSSSSSSLGRFLHYLPQKSLTALGIYLILSVLNPTLLLFLSIPKSSALIFEGTQARVLRCVLVCIGNPWSSLIKRMEWDTQNSSWNPSRVNYKMLLNFHATWVQLQRENSGLK